MQSMRLGVLGYALLTIYLWTSKVAAAIVNATIDDQLGDSVTQQLVNYYPNQNVWDDQTCGSNKCSIVLDKSQAFDKTYTAATYDPANEDSIGINMQFTGTAIYVFFIIANFADIPTLNSANFSVDGHAPVLFANAIPPGSFTPQYDVLVFSLTDLSSTLHTVNISATGPTVSYVNFDYAIYTYDNGVSTTTSSLASLSTVTTTAPAPSISVTGAPARRTQVGAIVGGIAGGLLLAVVIPLLFWWHRRKGHDALQSLRGNGGPEPLMTEFNDRAGSLAASASGVPYTQPLAVVSESPMATVTVPGGEPSNTDHQANIPNNDRTLHSGGVVLSTPDSQLLGTSGGNDRSASPLLPSPLNIRGTREDVRRARQEDLNNRLRMVQHNIVQLEELSATSGRSVSLRRQTSMDSEFVEEEMQMSMLDMQEAIRSLKEQMRILGEQQQSAWAQGLSDNRPPGYTPMEMGIIGHLSK